MRRSPDEHAAIGELTVAGYRTLGDDALRDWEYEPGRWLWAMSRRLAPLSSRNGDRAT